MLATSVPLQLRQVLPRHSLVAALCDLGRCNLLTANNGQCAFSTTAALQEEQQPQAEAAAPLPPASGPLVGIKASCRLRHACGAWAQVCVLNSC